MKADDHRKLTKKAIEIFHANTKNDFSTWLLNHSEQVEDGSEEADKSPLHLRITNWHFFKQNKLLRPTTLYYAHVFPVPVTPTSDEILAHRIGELRRELDKEAPARLEEVIGRILHHVQDMSTPAHVVPVYHGPRLKDSFEDYSGREIDSELPKIALSEDEYRELDRQRPSDIMAVYNHAALKTLHHLYDDPASQFEITEGPNTLHAGWGLFWKRHSDGLHNCARQPFDDIQGFGCYGPLGEQFGNEKEMELNGKPCKIAHKVYATLHQWVLREQVENSLRTLMIIDSMR